MGISTSRTRGGRDFNLLSSKIILTCINKVTQLMVDPRWRNLNGKGKGN
jgi:hypothetical protein